jgi:hypothetical protein
MVHSSHLAVYSLHHRKIDEQSRSRIHVPLGSVVIARGTAYGCQVLDRQGDQSGI